MTLDSPGAPIDTAGALAERASVSSVPAPASSPPPVAAPVIESTPSVSDSGSTPGSPAEGSTPEAFTPTQPAGPVVSEDELREHALRVAGGEGNLYRWIADSNARLAEAAARTKELEARLAGAPPATAQPLAVPGQPTSAQPAPGMPPVAAAPPVHDPGPVAPPSPEQVELAARNLVTRDPQMVSMHAEYHETAKLVGNPEQGIPGELGVVMGREGWFVPALDQRIQAFNDMLDPAKAAEIGITLDALQREEILEARARLQNQSSARVQKFLGLVARRDYLSRTYQARYDTARSVVMEDVTAAQEAQERETKVSQIATEMSKSWPIAFQSAVRAAGIHESLLPRMWERIKTRGRVASVQETEDLPTWMANAIGAERADMDEYHRLKSGEYSRKKEADAALASGRATSTTPQTAASPPKVMSYEEAREKTRSALEQRARLRQSA